MIMRLTFELTVDDVPDTNDSAAALASGLGNRIAHEPLPAPVRSMRLVEVTRASTYYVTVTVPAAEVSLDEAVQRG